MAPRITRLGHALLDRQHQRMVALSRAFVAATRRGRGLGELGALIRATRRHFASEERLMSRARYPERSGHRALHDGVMAGMRRMREELRAGRTLHRSVSGQVMEWLAHHTAEADRNLVDFLAG